MVKKNTNNTKAIAALCYLFSWITGIIFYFLEKDNKYVRFHAMQSIMLGFVIFLTKLFFGALAISSIIAGVFTLGIGTLIALPIIALSGGILALAYFIVWILLMYKAFKGEKYKLPIIGNYAEKYSK
ncbi:MAG: DUF4870 domain-containing protein [Candidatus Micrarchaeia archaeon]